MNHKSNVFNSQVINTALEIPTRQKVSNKSVTSKYMCRHIKVTLTDQQKLQLLLKFHIIKSTQSSGSTKFWIKDVYLLTQKYFSTLMYFSFDFLSVIKDKILTGIVSHLSRQKRVTRSTDSHIAVVAFCELKQINSLTIILQTIDVKCSFEIIFYLVLPGVSSICLTVQKLRINILCI